jgi:hypothetical protein
VYRNGNRFSELARQLRQVEEPGELPARVVNKMIIMQVWEFFPTCTIVANDGFEVLRNCK